MSSILRLEGSDSSLKATIVMETVPENSVDSGEASKEQTEITQAEGADTESEVDQATPEDAQVEGEASTEEEKTEGASDETMMPEEGIGEMEGMHPEMEVPQAKGNIMASWVFVVGITAAVLALGIVCGILLGKKRIKKGFDDYED